MSPAPMPSMLAMTLTCHSFEARLSDAYAQPAKTPPTKMQKRSPMRLETVRYPTLRAKIRSC